VCAITVPVGSWYASDIGAIGSPILLKEFSIFSSGANYRSGEPNSKSVLYPWYRPAIRGRNFGIVVPGLGTEPGIVYIGFKYIRLAGCFRPCYDEFTIVGPFSC
jgi:hypothetical protein